MQPGGFEALMRQLDAGTTRPAATTLLDPGAMEQVMAGFPVSEIGDALGDWLEGQNDYREARIAEREAAGVVPSEGPINWNAMAHDWNNGPGAWISDWWADQNTYRDERIADRTAAGVPRNGPINFDAMVYDLNAPKRERGVEFEGPVDWGGIGSAISSGFNNAFGGLANALNSPAPRAIEPRRELQDIKTHNGGLIEREGVLRDPESGLVYDPGTGAYYREDKLPANVYPKNPELAAQPAAPVQGNNPVVRIVDAIDVLGNGFEALENMGRGIANDINGTADVPFPRRDPRLSTPTKPAREDPYYNPNVTPVPPSTSAPQAQPVEPEQNILQNAVDMAGGVLDNTLLGAAVKHFFPDAWYDTGEAIKDVFGGGGGSLASTGGYDRWGDPTSPRESLSPTTDGSGTGLAGFVDLDGNGIDDRLEGGTPPAAQPPTSAPLINYAQAFFPDLPPYRPGVDAEWQYFRPRQFADGGLVEAIAAESPNGTSPMGGLDPRITIIADAEDALEGQHPDPETAIAVFVEAFGPDALEMLKEQVRAGMTLSGHQRKNPRMAKSRFVEGPGGPKDDAIPARIDEVEEARLSNGEFVVDAEAVRAAGDGDPQKGAAKLSQMSDALAQRAPRGLQTERVR